MLISVRRPANHCLKPASLNHMIKQHLNALVIVLTGGPDRLTFSAFPGGGFNGTCRCSGGPYSFSGLRGPRSSFSDVSSISSSDSRPVFRSMSLFPDLSSNPASSSSSSSLDSRPVCAEADGKESAHFFHTAAQGFSSDPALLSVLPLEE